MNSRVVEKKAFDLANDCFQEFLQTVRTVIKPFLFSQNVYLKQRLFQVSKIINSLSVGSFQAMSVGSFQAMSVGSFQKNNAHFYNDVNNLKLAIDELFQIQQQYLLKVSQSQKNTSQHKSKQAQRRQVFSMFRNILPIKLKAFINSTQSNNHSQSGDKQIKELDKSHIHQQKKNTYGAKVNPVIIIPQQQKSKYQDSQLLNVKSKSQAPPKQPHRQWLQQEIFFYAIFVAHLIDPMSYTNFKHLKKLCNWLRHYIIHKIPDSVHTSKITISQIQAYHKQNIKNYTSLDQLVVSIKKSLAIDEQSFRKQLQIFELQFPQLKTVLDYYSLNTTTQSYQQNCQIAQHFLNSFKPENLQLKKQKNAQQWTRYQCLTYVALLLIKKENQDQIKREDLQNLAQYSFGGKIRLLGTEHRQILSRLKKPIQHLVQMWKFTNEVIEEQKIKLERFLNQKKLQRQQNSLSQSSFELFLAERKTLRLNNVIRIVTDQFEMVSDSLECFIFSKQLAKYYKSNKKSHRIKSYPVYLKARFDLNEWQKQQLERLRQKLASLSLNFKDTNQGQDQNQYLKANLDEDQSRQRQIELEEGRTQNQKLQHSFLIKSQRYSQESQLAINKKLINQSPLNHSLGNPIHSEKKLIQLQQEEIICEQKVNHQEQSNLRQFFDVYTKTQINSEGFNASLQSTDHSFSFSNQSDNSFEKGPFDEANQNHPIIQLPKIQEEQSNVSQFESDHSDNEDQNFDKDNDNHQQNNFQDQQNNFQDQQNNFQDSSIQQFIQKLAPKEQSHIFQPIFEQKVLQNKLISMITNHETKKTKSKQDKSKSFWTFSQNLKFVSFLITTSFAFGKDSHLDSTFKVMSEFIPSKKPRRCRQHYLNNRKFVSSFNQLGVYLVQKFKLPRENLFKEVNRQKKCYLSYQKHKIFKLKKTQYFSRNLSDIDKSSFDLLVESLQKNPFIFNLKQEYLTQKDQVLPSKPSPDKLTQSEITDIQRKRYLDSLERFYKKHKRLTNVKLKQLASEIFKERSLEQQQMMLEKYHHLMMKKHKTGLAILQKEREKTQSKQTGERKTKAQVEKENNIRFSMYFSQQILSYKTDQYVEIEILKFLNEQIISQDIVLQMNENKMNSGDDIIEQKNQFIQRRSQPLNPRQDQYFDNQQ